MDKYCPRCNHLNEINYICNQQDCPLNLNITNFDRRPRAINYLPAKQPYLLSEAFLLRAIFVMTAFNFSIMLIFFLAGLFGGT